MKWYKTYCCKNQVLIAIFVIFPINYQGFSHNQSTMIRVVDKLKGEMICQIVDTVYFYLLSKLKCIKNFTIDWKMGFRM